MTAPLTLARAHRLTSNGLRARDALLVAGAVVVLVAVAGRGEGALVSAARIAAGWAIAVAVLVVALNWFNAYRLARRVSVTPVTWEFSPTAMTATSSLGRTVTQWWRVDRFSVRGDMLVLQLRGTRARAGAVVGTLAPEERERVLGWVAAGASAEVTADR